METRKGFIFTHLGKSVAVETISPTRKKKKDHPKGIGHIECKILKLSFLMFQILTP